MNQVSGSGKISNIIPMYMRNRGLGM